MNRYEGTIKSAVYSPDLTNKWGIEHGGLGYTLHVFIDLINGEKVEKVLGKSHAVIEMNVYSDKVSERYHYKDIKTGFIKTSYLNLVSPLVKDKKGNILCESRDIAIDEETTQRALLWAHGELEIKRHRRYENECYHMSDRQTIFYKLRKAHFRDLWIAEDVINCKSSYSVSNRIEVAA